MVQYIPNYQFNFNKISKTIFIIIITYKNKKIIYTKRNLMNQFPVMNFLGEMLIIFFILNPNYLYLMLIEML